MRFKSLLLALFIATIVTDKVRADVSYSYSVSLSSTFTQGPGWIVQVGGTVTASLYLNETLSSSSAEYLMGPAGPNLVGKGVYTVGVASDVQTGTSAAISSINANTALFPTVTSQAGSASALSNGGANAALLESVNFGGTPVTAPKGSTGNPLINQIYLGSLTISALSIGNTTFSLSSFNNSAAANTFAQNAGDSTVNSPQGYMLDQDSSVQGAYLPDGSSIYGTEDTPVTYTVYVVAVPEPSSMLLCGIAACGGAVSAYRRWKCSKQSPLAA